jgi:hypothetical protein
MGREPTGSKRFWHAVAAPNNARRALPRVVQGLAEAKRSLFIRRKLALHELGRMLAAMQEEAGARHRSSRTEHLAGALGVPVWLPLSVVSDWRWLREREDTLWYPSMRLFRQHKLGNWGDVFDRMKVALSRRVREQRGASNGEA